MRKLFRNRRGLSTVISTILMIMVVMVGMSLVFAYVAAYANNYKAGIGSSVMESLTLEDVWFKDSTTVQIFVYNVGKVDSTIATIYNNGVALTDASGSMNLKVQVNIGEHTSIILRCPSGQWPTSNNLKIVTLRGSNFEGQYTWPS